MVGERAELTVLGSYMNTGREYASMISLRAFAQALQEGGCGDLDKFEIKDINSYWSCPEEAQNAAMMFFEGFWRPGGCDLALLRAAMTRGKVRLA